MSEKKKELLDLNDEVNIIETTLDLNTIELKKLRWFVKMYVGERLPKTYHAYKIKLVYNDKPLLDRIADIENEFEETLFAKEKSSRTMHNKRIAEIRAQLKKEEDDCEKIEFVALVEELKYKDSSTLLKIKVPDDVIEAFNRQKTRFNIYKICLIPTTE